MEPTDLTALEREVRGLITGRRRRDWERTDTPFSKWAREIREAWAQTPAGIKAIREAPLKRGKIRRRVHVEPHKDP